MNKFTPHITFFGTLFFVITIGMLANSLVVARLSGYLVAFSIDPLIIIGGLVIGSLVKNQIKLIIIAITFGVAASLIITKMNASLGSTLAPITIILRCVSTLAWAYVANIFVVARTKKIIKNTAKDKNTDGTDKILNPEKIFDNLMFKDNNSAFDYACKYIDCTPKEGATLLAIVLDSKEEYETKQSVKTQDDGSQLAMIKVASDDGGFNVPANTAGTEGVILKPGDLVAWQAMQYMPELGNIAEDSRFGWVGLILGTLKPELNNKEWVRDKQL